MEPHIFSKAAEASQIPGSLHLREAIPGLTSPYPDNDVVIVRMGTPEGYAHKVYGDPDRYTGWDNYRSIYPSWNAILAYQKLWGRYGDRVETLELVPDTQQMRSTIRYALQEHDYVVSTLPRHLTCYGKHNFSSVPYYIKTLPLPDCERGREIIIYNGRLEDQWYRYSVLGDRCSIESTMPMDGAIRGAKVTHNDCNCWENIVIFAGRWAEWKHGILLHNAYRKVLDATRG